MARNILLTGFMGAGKTTVGRLLAHALGWRFIDLDQEIERTAGTSIADLFRSRGEAAFRDLESRLTAGLSSVDRAVIAPGGGWILDPANVAQLPPDTVVVWLRVSADEAVRRLRGAGMDRPLLAEAEDAVSVAQELLERREARYATAAVTIDVDDRTPAAVVEAIRSKLRIEG